jgi:UDP-N-acetylglucosamine/UDP-N-acetylgalactosamine diphosphorylase
MFEELTTLIDAAASRAVELQPGTTKEQHSQRHVLHFWPTLTPLQRDDLAAQVRRHFSGTAEGVVPMSNIFHESVRMSAAPPADIAPPPSIDVVDVAAFSRETTARYDAAGRALLARGGGAVIILAGGSGTRLGVSFPKGMLVCPDLAVPKSIFQLQCEKVQFMRNAVNAAIPLCFMTSPATDVAIRQYFKDNNFFGLTDVHFFEQSTMPCFTAEGKMVMATESSIAEAPGGNAGIYAALAQSGLLGKLHDEYHTEYCQVATVDNLLAKLPDAVFFGTAALADGALDIAVKTVSKNSDHEAVGVFAKRSYPNAADSAPRWGVVEYTEIGKERAEQQDSKGTRLFDAANIAIHLFSTDFLQRAAAAMQVWTYYHVARKPITTKLNDEQRAAVALPTQTDGMSTVTGVKLEAFIFDLFQFADARADSGAFAILNVQRSAEFSAIKNADDSTLQTAKKDSPQSAVADLRVLHKNWWCEALQSADGLRDFCDATAQCTIEISPLVADGPIALAKALSSVATSGDNTIASAMRALSQSSSATVVLEQHGGVLCINVL